MSKEINSGEMCEYTFWGAILLLVAILLSQMSFKADYISQHVNMALEEQSLYGIPASVTLAQGILESGWEESKAAKLYHNHFGIRCQNKTHRGECVKYVDAGDNVRIMRYSNTHQSYRAHSIYLTTGKYKDLREVCGKSYSWCLELQKRGYSSDRKYAEKLQRIIYTYNLEQFDDF